MSLTKYRVRDVAKDFNVSSKEISQILTTYATAPKNNMQVLSEEELTLIFEHMTQTHQMKDISEVYAVTEKPKAAEKPAAPAQPAAQQPS